ncbi:MAG: permease-like cell division protein FtsX [Prevotellaceae bacterium]|nr:permease-like cell division protein FtsX [Prevotellaceae bacterium]
MKKKVVKYKLFNSKLTSVISISMVLFMLGIIAMFILVGSELSSYVKENITLSVIIKESAEEADIQDALKKLREKSYIRQIRYITKEEALKELAGEMGEDPVAFLGYNPLSPSFEINLKSAYANNDSILFIAKSINTMDVVKQVDYQKNLIREVDKNIKRITATLLLVAGLLLIISFILINNTMRLLIYSNRFLIHTMKLVGATRHFIRKPYIIQGIIIGIIASIFAILYILGLFYWFADDLKMFVDFNDTKLYIAMFGTILSLGIVITGISTFFAVNKYLKHKLDDLYYL